MSITSNPTIKFLLLYGTEEWIILAIVVFTSTVVGQLSLLKLNVKEIYASTPRTEVGHFSVMKLRVWQFRIFEMAKAFKKVLQILSYQSYYILIAFIELP